MIVFDPRTIATPVYDALSGLRSQYNGNDTRLKEQKSQAVELYTYLSTWGMMRLKAEEKALSQDGKKDVVRQYFQCLQTMSDVQNLIGDQGLETLKNLGTEEYLGLTGLGLALSQEFAFWANAIYHDIKGEE
ncbi:hypothetical protein [Limnospira fusiformis]|jgi:hypothetical protein|uniref:hypothetical protein n=1 Tax=Limnospira fusiformis TaxID=54297 RepID=UPI001449B5BC|nr:hypothetical protein HFV01_18110 [Limnospira fusiformis SAG 85.79]